MVCLGCGFLLSGFSLFLVSGAYVEGLILDCCIVPECAVVIRIIFFFVDPFCGLPQCVPLGFG